MPDHLISVIDFRNLFFTEETLAQLNAKQENESKELALFWKLLPKILENAPAVSRLHDCAIYENSVRDVLYPGNWENQENMVSFPKIPSKNS